MRNTARLKIPKKLVDGDVVGVVSPAGQVDAEELRKGLAVLQKMGLRPLLGKHVLSRYRYLAGTDEDRAQDLMSMFENPEVKAIFCSRGGYGANLVGVRPSSRPGARD